jgi:hypothetical protein
MNPFSFAIIKTSALTFLDPQHGILFLMSIASSIGAIPGMIMDKYNKKITDNKLIQYLLLPLESLALTDIFLHFFSPESHPNEKISLLKGL